MDVDIGEGPAAEAVRAQPHDFSVCYDGGGVAEPPWCKAIVEGSAVARAHYTEQVVPNFPMCARVRKTSVRLLSLIRPLKLTQGSLCLFKQGGCGAEELAMRRRAEISSALVDVGPGTIGTVRAWLQRSDDAAALANAVGTSSRVHIWTSPVDAAAELARWLGPGGLLERAPFKTQRTSAHEHLAYVYRLLLGAHSTRQSAAKIEQARIHRPRACHERKAQQGLCVSVFQRLWHARYALQQAGELFGASAAFKCAAPYKDADAVERPSCTPEGIAATALRGSLASSSSSIFSSPPPPVVEASAQGLADADSDDLAALSSCIGGPAARAGEGLGLGDVLRAVCDEPRSSLALGMNHADPGSRSRNPPLLVVMVGNGLSNRARTIAAALVLAQRSGRRLALLWPLDAHCRAAFDDLYAWPEQQPFYAVDADSSRDSKNDDNGGGMRRSSQARDGRSAGGDLLPPLVVSFDLDVPPELIDDLFRRALLGRGGGGSKGSDSTPGAFVYSFWHSPVMDLSIAVGGLRHVYLRSSYWLVSEVTKQARFRCGRPVTAWSNGALCFFFAC